MNNALLGSINNVVLKHLPREELSVIQGSLSNVRLVATQVLVEAGERQEHVYFIESGIVSICDNASTTLPIQVALIGCEGMVGCESLLQNTELSFTSATMQHSGSAWRIAIRDLMVHTERCPALKEACMHSVLSLIKQVTETAASNARDSLARRCIRLLLMLHDRVPGEDVQITHQALSDMLGVRRSGVTQVATDLQKDGLICINRGRITILDRTAMERQVPRGHMIKAVGQPLKTGGHPSAAW